MAGLAQLGILVDIPSIGEDSFLLTVFTRFGILAEVEYLLTALGGHDSPRVTGIRTIAHPVNNDDYDGAGARTI